MYLVMNIRNIFERKKEKDPIRKEIREYLDAFEAIAELDRLKEEEKKQNYQFIAEKVLDLLPPEEVDVFELSRDIYAIREEKQNNGGVEDSKIKDLDWVERYSDEKV